MMGGTLAKNTEKEPRKSKLKGSMMGRKQQSLSPRLED